MNVKILTMIAALGLAAIPASAQTCSVTSATLTATPARATGPCPATIAFNGNITMSTGMTPPKSEGKATGMLPPMGEGWMVHYQFVRSDGAASAEDSVRFIGPGTIAVSTSWTLGGSYGGWMMLKIISPNTMESAHAGFTLDCGGPPKRKRP